MATGVASWSNPSRGGSNNANGSADQNVNMLEGMAPSLVNDGVRALMSSVAMWRDDTAGILTTGSATAFTIATSQGFASLAALDGRKLAIIMHTSSGATPTLSVDGLAAKPIRTQTGVALPTAVLVQGSPYSVVYNNSSGEFLIRNQVATIPAGVVVSFAGSTAPAGGAWLLCAGQAVNIASFPALYAAIGTTYGNGIGGTLGVTFGVPDLRGRVVAGVDNMNGSTAGRITVAGGNFDGTVLGGTGGLQNHVLLKAECPSGLITLTDVGHYHQYDQAQSYGCMSNSPCGSNSPTTQTATNTSGVNGGLSYTLTDHAGGGAHTVLQPTMTMNILIKT